MIVHCDGCGRETIKETAVPFLAEDGEICFFCSEECLGRCGHLAPVQPPDREDRGQGSGVPTEQDDDAR